MKTVSLFLMMFFMLGSLDAPESVGIASLAHQFDEYIQSQPSTPIDECTIRLVEAVCIMIGENNFLDIGTYTPRKRIKMSDAKHGRVCSHGGRVLIDFGTRITSIVESMRFFVLDDWQSNFVAAMVDLVRSLCSCHFVVQISHTYRPNALTNIPYVLACEQIILIEDDATPDRVVVPLAKFFTTPHHFHSLHRMPLVVQSDVHTKKFKCADLALGADGHLKPYNSAWYHLEKARQHHRSPAVVLLINLQKRLFEFAMLDKQNELLIYLLLQICLACRADPVIESHLQAMQASC